MTDHTSKRDNLHLLNCHTSPAALTTSQFEIYAEGDGDPDAVLVRIRSTFVDPRAADYGTDSAARTVSLDREGARQLFNWLGVWLHTG